jgi:hypothetical protein
MMVRMKSVDWAISEFVICLDVSCWSGDRANYIQHFARSHLKSLLTFDLWYWNNGVK